MTLLSRGIAHVSFAGEGLFLPVRSAYDRQLLAEHVAARVRTKGEAQVLLNDERWLVGLMRGRQGGDCSGCNKALDIACYAARNPDPAYCVNCALGGAAKPVTPEHERQCQSI